MSERYWLTGAQLIMLEMANRIGDREDIVKQIVENQFIGNVYTQTDQNQFKKEIKLLKSVNGKEVKK
jgi:hypothetical protein